MRSSYKVIIYTNDTHVSQLLLVNEGRDGNDLALSCACAAGMPFRSYLWHDLFAIDISLWRDSCRFEWGASDTRSLCPFALLGIMMQSNKQR